MNGSRTPRHNLNQAVRSPRGSHAATGRTGGASLRRRFFRYRILSRVRATNSAARLSSAQPIR